MHYVLIDLFYQRLLDKTERYYMRIKNVTQNRQNRKINLNNLYGFIFFGS